MNILRKNKLGRKSRLGFSFLEIMLVVVILGIMLAVVGPNLVGKSQKAKISATKQQIANFATALQMYEAAIGEFPSTDQGLNALVEKPSDVSEDDWSEFMLEIPKDSWGQEYQYTYPGEHGRYYDLISAGPDKQFGTEDDITNYKKDDE
ncbi:MAG: type II secretion system major pseudopilin GspG [Candidatus Sumerlaeia bacterium]